ncbi:PS-10 peptidase S37 [Nannocystis exedens]|uniref:PS-10 peptidase S37 n=1 Tax=Nannocystis exedens TaxID=54 RepID=A0A1I2CV88_9BACT|nr:S28 family serine protease [Nannocystis exedens]PCC68606.1 Prolyl tri/tetrapeptidyl aminopeptidase precursor [Nannocystis exedens]SFE72247.1 PS-10 peptidase S37 [Nannocystis exedens]
MSAVRVSGVVFVALVMGACGEVEAESTTEDASTTGTSTTTSGAGDATTTTVETSEASATAATVETSEASPTTGAEADILERLQAIDGLEVEEAPASIEGYRFFRLLYHQPADHAAAGGARFGQRMTLLHRDASAPMVMVTAGYDISVQAASPGEVAQFVAGNQLTIEHRFFTPSRPDPADWETLTIEQAAADHHRIAAALQPIYGGRWVSTGVSKGGMAALYHRRFYPDDVAGTVAYVAPLSHGTADPRYVEFVAQVGEPGCRQALQDAQREMLLRRPAMLAEMMEQAADDGLGYELLGLDLALERAVVELPFVFWQYLGAGVCDVVPTASATDVQVWAFLDNVNPPSGWSDDELLHDEPYFWQAATELGYPAMDESGVEDLLLHPGVDAPAIYVAGGAEHAPAFDPSPMLDVADWLATDGEAMMFIYGENDPWSAARVELGAAEDAYVLVAPAGNHGAEIVDLSPADRALALQVLERWTGARTRTEAARDPAPLRRPL